MLDALSSALMGSDNAAALTLADHVGREFLARKGREGDPVEAGTALLKMEAMKMENVIAAPRAGKVAKLHVKAGDTVGQGREMVELE